MLKTGGGGQIDEYVNDKIFKRRYIEESLLRLKNAISFKHGCEVKKSKIKILRRIHNKAVRFVLSKRAKNYVLKRLAQGKVDIPYIELVLTTKCTLNCKGCNNLMQYFDKERQYMGKLDNLISSVEKLLACVDSISWVRIIGGEPLLFKDLPALVEYLESKKQVRSFDIVTNATIMPSERLLNVLSKSKKSIVSISDYTNAKNLKTKIDIKAFVDALDRNKIVSFVLWRDGNTWFDPGRIYKRNRSKDEIIRNFRACQMKCVSLLDNKLFICPIASALSKLRGADEFSGDFIDLDAIDLGRGSEPVRKVFLDFYKQDFFKACDYCHNMWEPKREISIAEQLKGRLEIL